MRGYRVSAVACGGSAVAHATDFIYYWNSQKIRFARGGLIQIRNIFISMKLASYCFNIAKKCHNKISDL